MTRVGVLPTLAEVDFALLRREEGDGRNDGHRDSLRALLLLVLFAITFFAVMSSSLMQQRLSPNSRLLSLLSCMGAGVFLSACLLDLLPDVTESFEKAELAVDFPLPQATIGLGFLMVLALEQFALLLQERRALSAGYSLHGHSHEDGDEEAHGDPSSLPPEAPSPPAALPAILLVASLSLHALFEGLSLAVIPDAAKLLQVFAALLLHKSLIGLSLGIRLVAAQLRPLVVAACAIIFSIQVLIGGLAGLWIMSALGGRAGTLVSATLQGIACGTFLFITTMEALPHELPSHSGVSGRPARLLAVLAGCGVVVLFIFLFPEDSHAPSPPLPPTLSTTRKVPFF